MVRRFFWDWHDYKGLRINVKGILKLIKRVWTPRAVSGRQRREENGFLHRHDGRTKL